MTDFRGLRRQCGPIPFDGAISSVSFFDQTGRLLEELGDCRAEACLITDLILGREATYPTRAGSEFYAFATVAQGILEVSQGTHPSFSRRCTCRVQGEKRPCLVEVEPYFAGGIVAGAKVTWHVDELRDSTVDC